VARETAPAPTGNLEAFTSRCESRRGSVKYTRPAGMLDQYRSAPPYQGVEPADVKNDTLELADLWVPPSGYFNDDMNNPSFAGYSRGNPFFEWTQNSIMFNQDYNQMRTTPTALEKRISACLEQHGTLGYAALMTATQAANSPLLARTLSRMRRAGSVNRTVLTTTPPRTLYALALADERTMTE
jgi:hypothetical protein